jgi:hypothetical protein
VRGKTYMVELFDLVDKDVVAGGERRPVQSSGVWSGRARAGGRRAGAHPSVRPSARGLAAGRLERPFYACRIPGLSDQNRGKSR